MSFGVSLKRERELRGVSLAEIAKTTKISVRLLEAIEEDRYDILPEGVFRKSFIKSYAKYLGMNEDQILNKYVLEVQPSTAAQSAPVKPTQSFQVTLPGSRRSLLLMFGIFLMVLAGSCGFWYFTRASHNGEAPATQITPLHRHPAGNLRAKQLRRQGPSRPRSRHKLQPHGLRHRVRRARPPVRPMILRYSRC